MKWNKVVGTTEEQILKCCPTKSMDCIIIRKGSKHRERLFWDNHNKEWYDYDECCGRYFDCYPEDIAYWMVFPELPEELR